ncbi:hypothetical protein VDGE_30601 [Verticillium dahliae]|uniref:Uncharacterized protein n=1 Tax=Verticillium dahliae TaxID=27337 RepID=A0A444S8D0_VERDA|nr:hypothetical protein VDGE_30601 [Verticillium dahliae]
MAFYGQHLLPSRSSTVRQVVQEFIWLQHQDLLRDQEHSDRARNRINKGKDEAYNDSDGCAVDSFLSGHL